MNNIVVSGRLGKDAEITYASSGTSIIKFSLANNTGWKENKKTHWFNVVLFKRDGLLDYLKKGTEVIIRGSMESSSYEKDGIKRTQWSLIANELEFMSKSSNDNSNGSNSAKEDDSEIPF